MTIHYVQEGFIPGVDVLELELSQFVIQVMTILTVCGILAVMGQYFKQPSVIFAIIGGIILGPSCLGKVDSYTDAVIPSESLHIIKVIASFGLQIYLFVVGLELDLNEFKANSQNMAIVALSGMIMPFFVGMALSVLLYNTYFNSDDVDKPEFTTFAVFIGTAMCVTALPVLARILKENNMMDTIPGSIALSAAVINDAIAWILLVVAICLATASDSSVAGWVFFSIIMFTGIQFAVMRPAFAYVVEKVEDYADGSSMVMNNLLTATIVMFLLSGWIVQQIGIDPIVGCFIFGVCVPRESALYKLCCTTLENFVIVILLPIYFAISGIKTDLTQMKDFPDLPILILVIAVATFTKFIGAGSAALYIGASKRDAGVIAVLMNTRGLVELIVLNIGLTYKVLNVRIFSILVVMCLFTTFMTCPLLNLVYPESARTYISQAVPTKDKDCDKDSDDLEAGKVDGNGLEMVTVVGVTPEPDAAGNVGATTNGHAEGHTDPHAENMSTPPASASKKRLGPRADSLRSPHGETPQRRMSRGGSHDFQDDEFSRVIPRRPSVSDNTYHFPVLTEEREVEHVIPRRQSNADQLEAALHHHVPRRKSRGDSKDATATGVM